MGYKLKVEDFNLGLSELSKKYKIYAPKVFEGQGRFSDTDIVRYGEISRLEEIEFNKKSAFSYKEVLLPITQTLFFFTEKEIKELKEILGYQFENYIQRLSAYIQSTGKTYKDHKATILSWFYKDQGNKKSSNIPTWEDYDRGDHL